MSAPIEITIAVSSGGLYVPTADDLIFVPASGPEEGDTEMTRDNLPVIGQPRRLTVNVVNAPGTVGKAIADITALRVMAKKSPAHADSQAVYDTGEISDGSQLTSAQATGEFYVFLAADDFGTSKIQPKVPYYFSAAVKVSGFSDWIECDAQTRVEFKEDVVD